MLRPLPLLGFAVVTSFLLFATSVVAPVALAQKQKPLAFFFRALAGSFRSISSSAIKSGSRTPVSTHT